MRVIYLTDRQHRVLLKLVRRAALLDPAYGPLLDAVELDAEQVELDPEPVASRKAPVLRLVPREEEIA